jgi:hypothetical protein
MEMFKSKIALATALLAATSSLAPLAAHADTQSNKNTWRNLAIGSAVVGGYGLLHHNTTLGVLGVAGAAYSANRYEQERHKQSVENSWRNRHYYHRYHHYRR